MSTEKINEKIIALWKEEYSKDKTVRVPMFYGEINKQAILFVGLNPSFNEKGLKEILSRSPHSGIDYKWKNYDNAKLRGYIEIEVEAKKSYGYYSKCREIADENEMQWEHVDLFFNRETNQKIIKRKLYPNGKLTSFAKRQLDLSFSLIQMTDPKVIVVINALASDIIRSVYNEIIHFNEKLGFHFINMNKREIPIFFSGMLSGQHALDKGSFERLKWHIKQALNTRNVAICNEQSLC